MCFSLCVLFLLNLVSPFQPEELTNVLEISNIVFTSMFTLEMILKLTAFGFFAYLRNPYNIFDGIIVIIRSGGLPNMTTECYQNVTGNMLPECYQNVTGIMLPECYQNVTGMMLQLPCQNVTALGCQLEC